MRPHRGNMAAHRAAQIRVYQSGQIARTNLLHQQRRRSVLRFRASSKLVDEVGAAGVDVTSLGLETSGRYEIVYAEVDGAVKVYELRDAAGKVLLSGMGDDHQDALLRIAERLAEDEDS